MPELPEVETVRCALAPRLKNRTFTDVRIINGSVVAQPSPAEFAARVKGQTVAEFARRGKFLRFLFESGCTLTLHLRMTGCLTAAPRGAPCEKHTHLIFSLDDGGEIRYEDVRRFGKFWFAEKGARDTSGIESLGPEPGDAITAGYLREKAGKSGRSVKEMLLDQSVVAGIGNIYSDEILFAAGIRPDRRCDSLEDQEWARLAAAIPERTAFFIEKNAMTFEEYVLGKGREYRSAPWLRVYGRSEKPCSVCGGALRRTVIAGRSAVFCPHCQK